MCLRISRRKTTSAGVACRPRLRLLGRRFPKASYTAATSSSSTKTRSADLIQSSQRSSTSAAINPSPKLSCARRILITDFAPALRRGPFRTQQLVVELANDLDRLLQFLIIAQPAAHLGNPPAAQAELARAPARVAHGENRERMAFAAGAFCASPGVVADGALKQRAAQNLAGHGKSDEQLLPLRNGCVMSHSYN